MTRLIYITSRNTLNEHNEEFYSIQTSFLDLLFKANFLCVPVTDNRIVEYFSSRNIVPDMILLTGGEDSGQNPRRDEVELFLLRYSISNDVPVLGICRGMQQMLQFFNSFPKKLAQHVAVSHEVIGEFNMTVNSYHNYGYFSVPDNFKILAECKDSSIEAVYEPNLKWIGIMWHPERMDAGIWLQSIIRDYLKIDS